ncbi:MAG: hypothetical protein A3B96_01240 [Candidatus Spechtbacteria bacterium RIFCSPHIGHO2_02_FULL_43_15b]|uniref:Acylneuraminate cytidylyltransferase n=1 Tax=Candidatus Spechtbacteria bacterium RIFCSPHIGHO2_01_FULL_43_30 TaxID=1802158 RepID=A0A1G2H568_9BACT|nr:MAG: hypothetical protein A2827_03640 [Candidatus Spechtbacteria bacterium RIFCSPHIGHO2_01_FULL_43_30]OGZ59037.1 MAG: hypothetical protein A3B96_01240 [Candidatus Spechtbacteria bacterium RIFCSPHIGHO2_02_FULL_43_15b]
MKLKTDIIIQARMGSGRLPGKVMKNLCGYPMLYHVVKRARGAVLADDVVVATTVLKQDDVVEKFCAENGIKYFRGSEEDVLDRYYSTAKCFDSDIIVRVTSDCPLIDPAIIDECIKKFAEHKGVDYLSNISIRTFPRGLDTEVFSFKALEIAHKNAEEKYEREHVTPYIWENKKGEFKIGEPVEASDEYRRDYRLTVDYGEDFQLVAEIYKALYNGSGIINVKDALLFLDKNPEIASINAHCEQIALKP